MPKIDCYFKDLDNNDITKHEKLNKNDEYSKENCIVEYDKNSIKFSSFTGDINTLSFNEQIMNIYPLLNGILIKSKNENKNFMFFKPKEKDKKEKKIENFNYSIISSHPLNSIINLYLYEKGNFSNNFDIIKASKDMPFILIKNGNDGKIILTILVHNKNLDILNFKENINQMLSQDSLQLNSSTNPLYLSYILIPIYAFEELNNCSITNIKKVSFFKTFSHKKSLYVSILYNEILYVYQLKFKEINLDNNNDILIKFTYCCFKRNLNIFQEVLDYQIINSLINPSINSSFSFRINSNRNNSEQKFNIFDNNNNNSSFSLYSLYSILSNNSSKTLVYLTNKNTFKFLEGIFPVYSKNINLYTNEIKSFFIKNNKVLYINPIGDIDDNKVNINPNLKKSTNKILLNLSFNENEYIRIILYFIKRLFREKSEICIGNKELWDYKVYYLFLFEFFDRTFNENNLNKNHFNILCKCVFDIFCEMFNQNTLEYQNFYSDLSPKLKIEKLNDKLKKQLTKFCNINNNNLNILSDTLSFLKTFYENIRLYNYYDESKTVKSIINLLFNLIKITHDKHVTLAYLLFFNKYYDLFFIKKFTINYGSDFLSLPTIKSYLDDINIVQEEKYIFNHMENICEIMKEIFNKNKEKSNNISYDNISSKSIIPNSSNFLIFSLRPYIKHKEKNYNNFLIKIIESGYNLDKIKSMHPFFALNLLKAISKAKFSAYKYIEMVNENLKLQILSLLSRTDIINNILSSKSSLKPQNLISNTNINQSLNSYSNINTNINTSFNNNSYTNINSNNSNINVTNFSNISNTSNISNLPTDIPPINYDKKSKNSFNIFGDDRLFEVERILSQNRIIKVQFEPSKDIDEAQIEDEKFICVYKNLIKQHSSCIGSGYFSLNTYDMDSGDALNVKPLNDRVLLSCDEKASVKIDRDHEGMDQKEFQEWNAFLNAAAQTLKVRMNGENSEKWGRNWILFNKPESPSFSHGGFLFAMGLLNKLDSLYSTDVYQYMKTLHEGVTLGVLLGKSLSKIGSMDETLSRTLCMHISSLLPSNIEINIPINVQCGAIIGIGLLYFKTGNRLMTEMLFNQIAKIDNFDKSNDMKHIKSYNLCLGFSIGLINYQKGEIKLGTEQEKAIFNKMFDIISPNNKAVGCNKDNPNLKNVNLYSPTIYSLLSLIYIRSNNQTIISKINIPKTIFELEFFSGIRIFLAKLTINLIIYDSIEGSIDWVYNNVDKFVKELHENSIEDIENDLKYANKINMIDFSLISTHYYYSLAAGIMSIGYKYCGTNDKNVSKIIIDFIKNKLFKVKITKDIIVQGSIKFTNENKRCITKKNLYEILSICVLSLSMIMAGSCDLQCLKMIKIVRKKVSDFIDIRKSFGFIQIVNQALGILCLGRGSMTLSSSLSFFPFLFISSFPVFPSSPNDTNSYLPVLRFFCVRAASAKGVRLKDTKTGRYKEFPVEIEFLGGGKEKILPRKIKGKNVRKIRIGRCVKNLDYEEYEENNENIDNQYIFDDFDNFGNNDNYENIEDNSDYDRNYDNSDDKCINNDEGDLYFNVIINGDEWMGKNEDLMKPKTIYIQKRLYLPNILLTNIMQIDDKNKDNALIHINLTLDIMKNLKIPKNILQICIEYCEKLLKNWNNLSNFDLIFTKFLLLIMYYYVNTENLSGFLVIFDILNKIRNLVHAGNCENFEIMELIIKNPSLIMPFSSSNLKIVYEELINFLKYGLSAAYKMNVQHLITNSDNFANDNIDWNLLSYLKINGITFEQFGKLIVYIKSLKSSNTQDIMNELLLNSPLSEIVNEFNYDFIKNLCKY